MVVTQIAPGTVAQPPTAQSGAKLAAASREFESVLLGQWLQDAESTFATVPGSEEDDAGGQQMNSFATQQLAASFTSRGGVGIAKLVLGALSQADASSTSAATVSHAATAASNAAHARIAYAAQEVK